MLIKNQHEKVSMARVVPHRYGKDCLTLLPPQLSPAVKTTCERAVCFIQVKFEAALYLCQLDYL